MKPFAEKIFLIEIISQIKSARRALDQLRKAISDEGNAEAAYDHAVDFLNHAAVVSKILSPQKTGRRASVLRGEYLRTTLGIDDSDTALDRKLRNHLEHIDERLEDWIAANRSGIYIDKGLLPISFLAENEEPIRSLNPIKGIYRFLGEDFDLQAIMASLDRIFDAASERNKVVEVPLWGRDPSKE